MKKNTDLTIKYFLLLSTLHMLTITWAFFSAATISATINYLLVFNVVTWLGYSFFYVLLAILPAVLIVRFAPNWYKLTTALAIALSSFMMLFMKSDAMIFDLYNFHFNGFVWNLMTTKGGVSSLGSGADTYASIIIACAIIVFTQIILWFLSEFIARKRFINLRWKYVASLMVFMLLSTSLMYGISDVKNYGPILDSAKAYPFYKKVIFRGLAEKFGIKATRISSDQLSVDTSSVQYPLHQIKFSELENPPNIVILVAESLRWDRLTPEIMPNTWQFAQKAYLYNEHYSSGNGTREGLFGLFYGLYGSYWDSFLHAQKSPLLMD